MLYFLQPLINGTTDWNRMRDCLTQPIVPRRAGKTFATLALMIRDAFVTLEPQTSLVYVGHNHNICKMAQQDIKDVFDCMRIHPTSYTTGSKLFIDLGNRRAQFFFLPCDSTASQASIILAYGRPILAYFDHDFSFDTNHDLISFLKTVEAKRPK